MSIVLVVMVLAAEAALPDVFLNKGVLRLCSKFTGEHPYFATLLKSNFGMGVLL